MKYYIGQRVSLLHESGEGKVISIVDNENVEVDFGDDFPYDVHVDEIIPVAPEEDRFFGQKDKPKDGKGEGPKVMGNLFELSLAIVPEGGDDHSFRMYLLNPEGQDALYTCYVKRKHKYTGISYGKVESGSREVLGQVVEEKLMATRAFYFQFIFYKKGTGYPQVPFTRELEWNHAELKNPASYIPALDKKGYVFPLRAIDASPEASSEAEVSKKKVSAAPRPIEVADLHIEKLVSNPYALDRTMLMGIQLDAFEKAFSDALMKNADKLVLIHGLGEGKLRSEIQKRLREFTQVKSFSAADPKLYGNGATEVVLQ